MRIAVFCESLNAGKGGAERVAASLANLLAARGHAVWVVCKETGEGDAYRIDPEVGRITYRTRRGWQQVVKMRLQQHRIEVCHLFYFNRRILKFLECCPPGVSVTLQECTTPTRIVDNWRKGLFMSRLEAMWERHALFSQVARIRFTRQEFVGSVPPCIRTKVQAFPNAFEAHDAVGEAGEPGADGRYHLAFINPKKEHKRFSHVLRAFASLGRGYEDWVLDAYGSVHESLVFDEIRAVMEALSLEGRVRFHGEVDDIYAAFAASNLHVIASTEENFSLSTLEAMSCAVPTIGMAGCIGVSGLVQDGTDGLLVNDDRSVEELRDAMQRLMGDHCLRIAFGHRAFQAAQAYGPEKLEASWLAFFEGLDKEAQRMPGDPRQYDLQRHLSRAYEELMARA